MNKSKNLLILSLLFLSTAISPSDWYATAVVSVASSYLGCSYFKKKACKHSSQFWKDVAAGAGISFMSARCLEWLLLTQSGTPGALADSSKHTPVNVQSGNPAGMGLLNYQAVDNTICGVQRDVFNVVVSAIVSFIFFYLNQKILAGQNQNQQRAAEAQQNKEHRFQKELAAENRAYLQQENKKNRLASQAGNAEAEELFMDQFRVDFSKLEDRSSLAYTPAPLQEWLSDLDDGTFIHQHLLLSGYAGSGKSHTIRVIAHEIKKNCEAVGKKVEVFMIRQGRLSGIHKNETSKNIDLFFSYAKKYAEAGIEVIVLWDEIDVLTSGSSSDDSVAHDINSTVGVLKEIVDPKKASTNIRILATTNHPGKIDSAIKSRLTSSCELKLPTVTEREKLFRFLVQDEAYKKDKIWIKYAKKTEGWSLRDLQKFFKSAKKLSNNSFDKKSLSSAFAEIVRAKKASKRDFSEYKSRGENIKAVIVEGAYFVTNVAFSFVSGTANTFGGFLASWFVS